MSEATRRFLKLSDGTMHESAHGDWVRYDAFKTLTQRAEAAEARRREIDDEAFAYAEQIEVLRAERDALLGVIEQVRPSVTSEALLGLIDAALAVQP